MNKELHPISLTFGVLYVIFGVAFLLEAVDAFDLRWDYVWPVALIVAGVAVLISAMNRGRPDVSATDSE